MRLVTAREMRALDAHAINTVGIPGVALMELAGSGTVREMVRRWPVRGASVLVVAGRGNNGGDGFVIARHLHNHLAEVNILLLGNQELVKGDAKINMDAALALKIPLIEVDSAADILYLEEFFHSADFIVDALFGTGLDRPVTGDARELIAAMEACSAIKVAVDLPSGLNADTGSVMGGAAAHAHLTVTFGYGKVGQFTSPGYEYCGEVEIVDISLPPISHGPPPTFLLTDSWVRKALPPRPPGGHKGSFGHVVVVGGSRGKVGAALLCSEAAVSMGSGLVTVAAPMEILPVLMNRLTEAMCTAINPSGEEISPRDTEALLDLVKGKRALLLGPGLPTGEPLLSLVRGLVTRTPVPLVIDADGLNLLARDPSCLRSASAPVLLTPHPGEMARLMGTTVREVQEDRRTAAVSFAKEYGVHVALKGARTVVASPTGRTALCPTGNSGMGTGGSGDVLTGMVGALIAQRQKPFEALCTAVYLHGRAGDLVAQEKGEYALRASDLISHIPAALRSVASGGE